MSEVVRERAPAKVNLLLHVGPLRDDGLHELCSLFASVDLADELEVSASRGAVDVVRCPGVQARNLAEAALAAFRAATGDALPPVEVSISKRVPVAAGLGGGSADAAAALRAANEIAGRPLDVAGLRLIAAGVGADVPSQIKPGHALVRGAGEVVDPVELPPMALVLVTAKKGLATGDVYRQADRMGCTRAELDFDAVRALARRPLEELAAGCENDLEPAALALRPELARPLDALMAAGARAACLTGSGPTAFGVFPDERSASMAAREVPGAQVVALAPSRRSATMDVDRPPAEGAGTRAWS